jgi:hypothetical protein
MIVQSPAPSSFEQFVAANTRFWAQRLAQPRAPVHGCVLVDLLHNNGSVLLLNLLVGRYIAEYLNAELAAFVAPTFTAHPVPVEEVKRLAGSFGITRIADIDTKPVGLVRSLWHDWRLARICRRLEKLHGSGLRHEILGLRAAGVAVGELIYDSYIDVARKGTIETFNEGIRAVIARALRTADDIERLMSGGDVRALVVCHPVYVDYGVPLRLSLKHGVPVFGKVWLDPIGMRRYQRPEEAVEFAGMPLTPAIEFFRDRLGVKLNERACEFFPPAPAKAKNVDYLKYGYGADKVEHTRQGLIDMLAIDPSKRTCVIMAQQFTDCPHCYPDLIFDDYFQWLKETLAFADTQPHLNWLVRQHPYEIMVGETEFFEDLVHRRIEGRPHIKVVPNTVTTSSLFNLADGVTTATGSGGIEFASVGVPCILAGNPFYGDCDFVIRPRTREGYFTALARIPELSRLSERQIMAAKEAALVYLKYKRVSSDRVPFISDLGGRQITQADIDGYWHDAAERLHTHRLEDDPLYKNLRIMLEGGHISLLDFLAS